MDRKMERLVLILEGIALLTALILILVDYKLKADLTELYVKMEATLDRGQKLFGENASAPIDSMRVPNSDLVGNVSPLETPAGNNVAAPNGQSKARNRTPAKRSGRNGNPPVSESN